MTSTTLSTPSRSDRGTPQSDALRILHLVEAFGGGVFEVVRWLAERHIADGHSVAIAYGVRPETPEDVRAVLGPEPDLMVLWRDRSLRSQVQALRAIPRVVSEWSPDIVHLHSSFATAAGSIRVPTHLPRVCSPHAYSFMMVESGTVRNTLYRLVETFAARRVNLVGAVSESEARVASEVLRAPRVTVVANGIPELDRAQSSRRDSLPPRVVAMGRAEEQRQPDACARIMSGVRDLGSVEWIGGGSTTESGVAALAHHDVPMSGWLDRSEAMDRLGAAGVYLHYTAWDGQPLSVLEAMARDVAVVASDIPANREILGPELVCASEEEAINTIRRLLTDPESAARHLALQRARRGHYSTARMAAEWLDVYRTTIARKQP